MGRTYKDNRQKYKDENRKHKKNKSVKKNKSYEDIYPSNKKWDIETGEYIE